MPTIDQLKELETPGTPLFLLECTLASGDIQRWSTHSVTAGGLAYLGRVVKHNLFELKSSSDEASDGISKLSISLANADSLFSSVERNVGWKGARLTVKFLFFDLAGGVAVSESKVVFRGTANPPEESTEALLRLSFTNRLNLQRVFLPEIRIQKRCPWSFPSTAAQRAEAAAGGEKGKRSAFYRCGYSAGESAGVGNLNGSAPYTDCDFTRIQCQARGMFDQDGAGHVTRRFGGVEFVPASILVRSYGEKGSHVSPVIDNQARYNDFVPLTYGTGWYKPPVIFARNDGNLTHLEILLGAGEISDVVKVVVNNIEIPSGKSGQNPTATGWYNVVTPGARAGAFNPDFADGAGHPLGDPYGSMAVLSVVVPNRISDGRALPAIDVLIQGMKLERYGASGAFVDEAFTNNPAWVLLDVLMRSGWTKDEVDLASFALVAQRCDELVHTNDLHGNATLIPRYQCNLILTRRRSAADIVRGIRNASSVYLIFGDDGRLQVRAEDALAAQQPAKAPNSNSRHALNGGWPAYEFGDNVFSGILRRGHGEAALRTYSRSSADAPNRFTVEFQDEFNEYQQDSLSLVDIDDSVQSGQEISAALAALGLPNYDQAARATALQLNKSIRGNTYVDFETSVRALGLKPGDLIALTYAKEGFDRQPFRILRMAPGTNYRTAVITAQIHDDAWYSAGGANPATGGGRQPNFEVRIPRPLVGASIDENGQEQFAIVESAVAASDGSVTLTASVGFVAPERPAVGSAAAPLVGLNARVDATGGTLAGGQTLYYGVSSVDANGSEGPLSFLVKAAIPSATDTNQATLPSLSFPTGASAFRVYRGATPAQLLRIAANAALASSFTDAGLVAELKGPPDFNYDHANFYWRLEQQPETKVDVHSATTVGNSTLHMLPGELQGATARISKGAGVGQERTIASNTATTITVTARWDIEPDASSYFVVADSAWQFGATSMASPVTFNIPNREGLTIDISGRAANVRDEECAFELSPLTRWRISGAAAAGGDAEVPGLPTFGLAATGEGKVEVAGVAFASLTNTRTISAGTLTLGFSDELKGPSSIALAAAMTATDTAMTVAPASGAQAGDLIQVETEIVIVQSADSAGAVFTVQRAAFGSVAAGHAAGAAVYRLDKKTFILPFPRDFFGSPASGSYAFPIAIPDVRIAAAELFFTNSRGASDVKRRAFTGTTDIGLRTLSGGQLSIQIEGLLAIQTNAAPPLLMESTHSVRDVYAVVRQAPTGTPIQLRVTQNGQPYCTLSIPVGATISNVVDGFALGPLAAQAQIGLDITAVSQTSTTFPGRDLTVTIRL